MSAAKEGWKVGGFGGGSHRVFWCRDSRNYFDRKTQCFTVYLENLKSFHGILPITWYNNGPAARGCGEHFLFFCMSRGDVMRIANECFVVVAGSDVVCVEAINRTKYKVRYTVNGTVYNDIFNAGDMLRVENVVLVFSIGEIVRNTRDASTFYKSSPHMLSEMLLWSNTLGGWAGHDCKSRNRAFVRVTRRVTLVFGKSTLPSLLIRKR